MNRIPPPLLRWPGGIGLMGFLMKATVPLLLLGLFLSSPARAQDITWPGQEWTEVTPELAGLNEEKLHEARAYAQSVQGSGLIIYQGKAVLSWG